MTDIKEKQKFRVYQKLELFVYCDVEADSKEEALRKMPIVSIDEPAPWHIYEKDGVETIYCEAKAINEKG